MRGDFRVEKGRGESATEGRKKASLRGFLALPFFFK